MPTCGDRRAFAEAHGLTIVRGHLELPDLRIEYHTEDGRVEHRDVEVVTEHYSSGQMNDMHLSPTVVLDAIRLLDHHRPAARGDIVETADRDPQKVSS